MIGVLAGFASLSGTVIGILVLIGLVVLFRPR